MKLPLTLSIYIGRQFLVAVAVTILAMLAIVGLVELLELVRRSSDSTHNVPFVVVFEMMALKLPTSAEKIYPFAFMVGSMVALGKLTRNSELVVTRAAGISVWQFLMPGIIMSMVMGIIFVTLFNPVAAITIARYQRMETKYISNKPSLLSILPSGLWLRQIDEKGITFKGQTVDEYVLHAVRMDPATLDLETVILFLYDKNHHFLGRIDASSATLKPGQWEIHDALLSLPGDVPQASPHYVMPTQLTMTQIEDSFSDPETFSFWQLPSFIRVLEKAGFSALQHKLHFHSLVAMPLLLAGMLMLSAVFSLRPPRRGQTGILIVMGMAVGFMYYFATNVIYALGSAGSLPIALAAWAPSLIVVMIASSALLHLEDG